MKSQSIKKLYNLHSWVGIITGILLFVIAFTGAVSVFGRPELKIWANPDMRSEIKLDLPAVEKLVAEYATQVPEVYREEVIIFLPLNSGFKNLVVLFEAHHGVPSKNEEAVAGSSSDAAHAEQHTQEENHGPAMGIMYQFEPETLALISKTEGEVSSLFEGRRTDMADFIVTFHADLHLGRPTGLLLTGFLGLTLMVSIITGILIHRKILKQLFTFRPQKSFSLLLNDGHKAIGVWGLLFNSTIAFTGAFLGLALVILVPAAAFVTFEGDQEKLLETFTAMSEPALQHIEKPTQVATIIESAENLHDEAIVSSATILGYGDAAAMVYVNIRGGEQVAAQTAVYKGDDASFVEVYSNFGRLEGVSGNILDLMFPLHFGSFGGVFVKAIWAFLGLGTALLPLTGLMLWLERGYNAANPKYSEATYLRLNRLVVGACGGIMLATFALFPAQMFINTFTSQINPGNALAWVFFPVWGLSTLVTLFIKSYKQSTLFFAWGNALLLLTVMPLNIVLTSTHLFNATTKGEWTSVAVDVITFATGMAVIRLILKYRQQLTTTDQSVKAGQSDASDTVLAIQQKGAES